MVDKRPAMLVLDQWAKVDSSIGTSKNWLYKGLGENFNVSVINADNDFFTIKQNQFLNISKSIFKNPFGFKKEYFQCVEQEHKYPQSFLKRTERFQKVVNDLHSHFDVVLQIGCLFGPVFLPGAIQCSYHDQTVAMVERGWPEWLPRNFAQFRDSWMQLEKKSLQAKNFIFTYSECTRQSMIADYGITSDRVVVMPTACKLPFPDLETIANPRENKLLFVSTDFYRKGGDVVFEAFRMLRSTYPTLKLHIVGGAPPMPLPEGATYSGVLSQGQLIQEYLTSTLIIHPARYDAFPNVLKEAQACGLPAIASSSLGIPEIVIHGRNGLVVPQIDPAVFAENILDLINDSTALCQMRRACSEDRDRFQAEHCIDRMTSLIFKHLTNNNFGSYAS